MHNLEKKKKYSHQLRAHNPNANNDRLLRTPNSEQSETPKIHQTNPKLHIIRENRKFRACKR